jgi:hypothetical protein
MIKLAFSPHRWTVKRSSSKDSVKPKEQWDLPVPGIYEYKTGRGWYLTEYLENFESSPGDTTGKNKTRERLPRKVTYCQVLHRMMFTDEYEERRHWEYVKTSDSFEVEEFGFFRMDDGITYVSHGLERQLSTIY